ncbi:chemotaxis protein methyltransferase CheR [Ferrimonas marina]|uniref:Chemotaxis protein methyltransferase n=2 Tax=Ferrimonas marina TaxID=299255 RepID=A0A1M5YCI9_9GAMM|nr:protein-glutamate O-methyltransferase CheR [Ferrimonas marina]SHI09243.1 chemotaxis protein methyltransferase CheR [Ferrimonas marina]
MSQLCPDQYQRFASFLQQQSGIELGDNKQYLVRSRLTPLLERHNHSTLADLVHAAMQMGQHQLRTEVVEAMTTNETFWFRDGYPFELMLTEVLPELAGRVGRPRIWSAACSSGQEPYSLAMTLQEFRLKNPGRLMQGAELLATDIDNQILAQAQAGEYDALAMARGLTEQRKQRFFEPLERGRMRIKPELRQAVSFRRANLLDSYVLLGKFDVIFCRNVLIYFSPDNKRKILRQFAAALNPGGYLFLGASESLSGLADEFEMVRYPGGMVYRRR